MVNKTVKERIFHNCFWCEFHALCIISPGVDFTNIFARLIRFFAWNKMISFFGKQRTDLQTAHRFEPIIWWVNYWWNWTSTFLPKAVRRHLFPWQTNFGKIDPCWSKHSLIFLSTFIKLSLTYHTIRCGLPMKVSGNDNNLLSLNS